MVVGHDEDHSLLNPTGHVRRRLALDRAVRWLLLLAFAAVLFPLLDMVYWISARAVPAFTWGTFTEDQVCLGGGLHAMIIGTLFLIGIATAFAVGIGVLSGMYTAEYAPPAVARSARVIGNVLAGVPAIVIGYFGYYALVLYTHWGFNSLAGGVALGVFMVPFVYRTTDIGFASVPRAQREATLALGARRSQYLVRVALPIALPTMLSGVFLAMAIGLGETAPLVYTAGWSSSTVTGLLQPTSYLTGAIWNFYDFPSTEGSFLTLAFQAAFLLIVISLTVNIAIQVITDRYRRRLRGLFQ